MEQSAHRADFTPGFDLSFDALQKRPFVTRLAYLGLSKRNVFEHYLSEHGDFVHQIFVRRQSRRDLTVSFQGRAVMLIPCNVAMGQKWTCARGWIDDQRSNYKRSANDAV